MFHFLIITLLGGSPDLFTDDSQSAISRRLDRAHSTQDKSENGQALFILL